MTGGALSPSPDSPTSRAAPERIGLSDRRLSARQVEILEDLDAILVEEGFSGFTMQQLAARLHCSRRTLYELAPSKDELVLYVIDRRLRQTGRLAAEALTEVTDPAERLTAFIIAGGSKMRHTTLRYQEDVAAFPAAQRLISAHYRYATAIVADLISDGIARGRFRKVRPTLVAEVVDAAFERLQDPVVLREHGLSFEDAASEVVALLRASVVIGNPSSNPQDATK
jgi:AcrR family transcriptional regulator